MNSWAWVSHRKLKEFFESDGNEDARVPLERWYEIADDAVWNIELFFVHHLIPADSIPVNTQYLRNLRLAVALSG